MAGRCEDGGVPTAGDNPPTRQVHRPDDVIPSAEKIDPSAPCAPGHDGAGIVLTDDGRVRIETPRDRDGSFEPLLLPKHARRCTAFDDSIVALYARGLTVREIQGYLAENYGTEVSPDLISTVTDGVLAEVTAWQARPLETVYPVVFFDALRVKVREDNVVCNKAVYLALGVRRDGSREILGLWIETTEGAKFWMKVFNDLKTCGVDDILIAVTDGLTGMPAALAAVFPRTTLQTCIVHLIHNSLDYASWKDRKTLAAALRPIYAAASADAVPGLRTRACAHVMSAMERWTTLHIPLARRGASTIAVAAATDDRSRHGMSLVTFGDLRLDKGGARSSNRWSRARRCVCAGSAVTVAGELRAGRFFANRKVTAAKIVEGWSIGPVRRAPGGTCWRSRIPPR